MRALIISGALALIVAGCAIGAQHERGVERSSARATIEKRRICTITKSIDAAAFCKTPKRCPEIDTCAEAYFRYTTCKEWPRDGGVAGKPNGIPCEKRCGRTALAMARKIRERPFLPPMRTTEICDAS
jgi:hypothetical protein